MALHTLITEIYGRPLMDKAFVFQFNVHRGPQDPSNFCAARGFGWHSAPGWNLATVARGAKNWSFASTENMLYLRPFFVSVGTFFSYFGHGPKADENDRGRILEVPTVTITQRAGDVIYFPGWFPHKTVQVGVAEVDNEIMMTTYRGFELFEATFTDLGIGIAWWLNTIWSQRSSDMVALRMKLVRTVLSIGTISLILLKINYNASSFHSQGLQKKELLKYG